MPAGNYDFHVEQGVKAWFEVEYKDPASNPKDLTGYQGRGHVKMNMGDHQPVAELDIEITDAPAGKLRITLPASALQNVTIPTPAYNKKYKAVYDVELFIPDDDDSIVRLLNGFVYISPEVTKE